MMMTTIGRSAIIAIMIVPITLMTYILLQDIIITDADSVISGLFANHTSGYLPALQFPLRITAGPEVLSISLIADIVILPKYIHGSNHEKSWSMVA